MLQLVRHALQTVKESLVKKTLESCIEAGAVDARGRWWELKAEANYLHRLRGLRRFKSHDVEGASRDGVC